MITCTTTFYIQTSSCSFNSSVIIQSVLYSPVQDLDPLPVVYTGIIPYVPYGHTLYHHSPTNISQPASTYLGHPRSINSDPRLRIFCDSARIRAHNAIKLPPKHIEDPGACWLASQIPTYPIRCSSVSPSVSPTATSGYQTEAAVTYWCCPTVSTRGGAERHYPKLNSKIERMYEQSEDYIVRVGCQPNTNPVLS